MDDVYLVNNPFTFQAMEKHSAYCAMMRLGLNVPETWLVPHKVPPANPRFLPTAERYNPPFDLDEVGDAVGYPLFMKPFDGGQWVGVTRIRDSQELHAVYDASGERLMHLQAAVEDFDVFARIAVDRRRDDGDAASSPTGRCTTATRSPTTSSTPELGERGAHHLAARQRVLPLGVQLVRDDRQGRDRLPDRLRQRVPRRRADEPPLLLPVGDRARSSAGRCSVSRVGAGCGSTRT